MKVTEVRLFCRCCRQYIPTKIPSVWQSEKDGKIQIYAEVLDPLKEEGSRQLIEIFIDLNDPPAVSNAGINRNKWRKEKKVAPPATV